MVPQYTKDHLKSVISLPPDWPGNDTTQMILGDLAHRHTVTHKGGGPHQFRFRTYAVHIKIQIWCKCIDKLKRRRRKNKKMILDPFF